MSTPIENVVSTEISSSPANVGATTQHNMNPSKIYKAIAASDIEFLKANTLEIGSFVSPAKNTILHIYIISRSKIKKEKTMVQTLRSSFRSVNPWFKDTAPLPLSPAETVREMLKEWPSLLWQANGKGDTPLHTAARHNCVDIVEALISYVKGNREKKDVEAGQVGDKYDEKAVWKMLHMTNATKETALHEAVRYAHRDVVDMLIKEDDREFSYSANEDGETPLYMAAERFLIDVVGWIVDKYTFPAYKGPYGSTALHAAARCGFLSNAVEVLTKKEGLELLMTKADEGGRTPLHYNPEFLVESKDIYAVYVIDEDGNPALHIADRDGNTALHIAASKGNSRAVKGFIEKCPECFDSVDGEGRNALHLAVQSGNKSTVDLIFENELLSELLKQKDKNGNTPMHLLAASTNVWPNVQYDFRFDWMAFNTDNLSPGDVFLRNKLITKRQKRRYPYFPVGMRPFTNSDTMNVKENGDGGQVNGSGEDNLKENGDGGQVNGSGEDNLKDERQSQLVVAALIATVTFAAGFTLPGGYIQEKGPDQGYAVLTKNAAFVAFVISDSLGLAFSCAAVFMHLLIALEGYKEKAIVRKLFGKVLPLTLFAIVAMVIAFVTGTFAVLANSLWLAILVSVIGGVFFFLLGHLVEEARDSTSFPIFRWIILGLKWLSMAVGFVLLLLPLMCYELIRYCLLECYLDLKEVTRIIMLHGASYDL